MVDGFARRGWARLPYDPALESWARTANEMATAAMADPAFAHWWVCEDTWFVGVDALNNDRAGRLPNGTALPQALTDTLNTTFGAYPFHKAQISVIRPGYPKPRAGESAAGFRYRFNRDAAHVDGLKPEGPNRRRMVKEPHAYILGIPLNDAPPEASPLVVWEGSHEIMRAAMTTALGPHPEQNRADIDVTEIYQSARREVFDSCKRVAIHARPGEAYVLHRLSLHGVAPWNGPDSGDRRIAYFRPALASVKDWMDRP